jgi:hypothetical protein
MMFGKRIPLFIFFLKGPLFFFWNVGEWLYEFSQGNELGFCYAIQFVSSSSFPLFVSEVSEVAIGVYSVDEIRISSRGQARACFSRRSRSASTSDGIAERSDKRGVCNLIGEPVMVRSLVFTLQIQQVIQSFKRMWKIRNDQAILWLVWVWSFVRSKVLSSFPFLFVFWFWTD